MPQRSIEYKNFGDYNWRYLWEPWSKKSQRRYARAWVHPLPGDLPISEALAILEHPTGLSELTVMSSNLANHPLEDQFLIWRQEMEARQEEKARQMAELREHANRLREDNESLRTRLEGHAEKSRGPPRPLPPSSPDKGKEAVVPDNIDLPADDELSSDSSPLPSRSPSPNAVEAQSRKRPPRRSSRSISVARCWVQREASRDRRQSDSAREYVPERPGSVAPPVPSMYPPFRVAPAPNMFFSSAVRGPQNMLFSPLGQHILDYKPPHGFSILSFAMYNDSSDPYDHMLHFNQAMVLNAKDNQLLCKVFPASLKGPALTWFHKLLRGSLNSFGELWAAFISQYLCSVRQKGNINSL